jgi:hypothetical protein
MLQPRVKPRINVHRTNPFALKGRDMGGADVVSAFQALGDSVEHVSRPFRPGYLVTGLRS